MERCCCISSAQVSAGEFVSPYLFTVVSRKFSKKEERDGSQRGVEQANAGISWLVGADVDDEQQIRYPLLEDWTYWATDCGE